MEARSFGRSGSSAAPSMSQRSRRDFLWTWEGSPGLATGSLPPQPLLATPRGHIHQAGRHAHILSPNTLPANSLPKQRHTTISFQPAQSTGPAKLRKTSQGVPLHPSVDLRLLSSHPNWEKPFTFPILFQSGAAVSMATFRSPPLHLPLPKLDRGSYCLSVGLTKTFPLHCRGWTGVPNLEPLHAKFLFLQLPTRSADLLLQSPLLLRTHDPELRAGPVPPFARLLGAPGPPGPPGASSRGRGPQSADSAAGGAGRGGAGRDQAAAP